MSNIVFSERKDEKFFVRNILLGLNNNKTIKLLKECKMEDIVITFSKVNLNTEEKSDKLCSILKSIEGDEKLFKYAEPVIVNITKYNCEKSDSKRNFKVKKNKVVNYFYYFNKYNGRKVDVNLTKSYSKLILDYIYRNFNLLSNINLQ